METTTAKPVTEKEETARKGREEQRYVIDKTTGRKISKAWQAMQRFKHDPWIEIVDMKAVVEGLDR